VSAWCVSLPSFLPPSPPFYICVRVCVLNKNKVEAAHLRTHWVGGDVLLQLLLFVKLIGRPKKGGRLWPFPLRRRLCPYFLLLLLSSGRCDVTTANRLRHLFVVASSIALAGVFLPLPSPSVLCLSHTSSFDDPSRRQRQFYSVVVLLNRREL